MLYQNQLVGIVVMFNFWNKINSLEGSAVILALIQPQDTCISVVVFAVLARCQFKKMLLYWCPEPTGYGYALHVSYHVDKNLK